MNIDMWIGHRDARGGKGFLKSVQHVVIAGPIVLRTRPEAQDILDRIVAIALYNTETQKNLLAKKF